MVFIGKWVWGIYLIIYLFEISFEKVFQQQKTTCTLKNVVCVLKGNNYLSFQVVVTGLGSGLSQD